MHVSVGTNPPQIVLPPTSPAVADDLPEAIFGKKPPNFSLEIQPIQMLDYWHHKACMAVKALPEGTDDETAARAGAVQQRLLAAIKNYRPRAAHEVARMLEAIAEALDGGHIEEPMTTADFRRLQDHLTRVTDPIQPAKQCGLLKRGRKLTRAGLLMRYASLLATELQTVSWHLFGERDYLRQFTMFDHAVSVRVRVAGGPFNDECTLTDRARKVLGSLLVDVERDDDQPTRRKGGER